MKPGCFSSCVVAVVTMCTAAAARPTAVQLFYSADPRIPDCPDLLELRRAVERRLGRSPWDAGAERQIRVRVTRAGAERRATVEIRDRTGVLGQRVLRSLRADCRELAEAMALTISIAVDPLGARGPTLDAGPAPRPAGRAGPPARSRPSTSPARRPTRRPGPPRLTVGLGGAVAVGTAPGLAGSASIRVGARWRLISAAAEGRLDLPVYDRVPGGRFSTRLSGGSLLACGHHRWLFGCGLVMLAAFTAQGYELLEARSATRLYAGAGARAGISLPLRCWLALDLRAELLVPFARVHVVDSHDGARYWSTPTTSGTFGLDLVSTFL